MKVPLSWIREFVDVTASAEEIGTLMGVRGLRARRPRAMASLSEHGEPTGDDVVMDFDVTANRPDCMSASIGIAREIATAYGLAACDASALAGRRRTIGRTSAVGRPGHDRRSGSVRPLCRRDRRRHRRPVAAVDAGSADDVRRAADQQHRRHHQLRDARARPADARLRSREDARRRDHGAPRQAGRDDDDARRQEAHADRRHAGDRRRRARGRHRRRDGRRGLGSLERHAGGSCSKRRTSSRVGFASTSKKLGLKTEASIALRARRRSHRAAARDGARAASCSRQIGAGKPRNDHRRLPAPYQPKTMRARIAQRIAGLLGMDVPDDAVERILTSLGFDVSDPSLRPRDL